MTQYFDNIQEVTLDEVLAFRDEKKYLQDCLLRSHPIVVICLGINMPGAYKRFPLADRTFHEGITSLRSSLTCEQIAIVHEEILETAAGLAAFFSVDASPIKMKEMATNIEDNHPLGRLLDIDVLRANGEKLSRRDSGAQTRPCLICGGDAFACGRSRTHSAEELQEAALDIILQFQRNKLGDIIARAALRALVSEAAITPKPGLVDRANSGAHTDMDFFTFIDSTAAIIPFFRHCAQAGFDNAAHPAILFKSLVHEGKKAEQTMLQATGGINTHQGLIFSIGLASAAFGTLFRWHDKPAAEDILNCIASMTGGIENGRMGSIGAREEARLGFPSVRDYALPALRQALKAGASFNDAGLAALLQLLSVVSDTNIIRRSGSQTLAKIQHDTAAFLAANPDINAITRYAAALDTEFIEKNISPGGCADLLALSLFLYWLTEV